MALRLTATDSHLSFSGASFLGVNDAQTIEFWATVPSWASVTCLVGLYGPGATPTSAFQIGTRGTGFLDAWTWGGTTSISSATAMTANTSYHIAFTSSNGFWRLYINGVVSKVDLLSVADGTFDQIYVNGYPTMTTGETSTSLVENLSIYNRSLLPRELQTIAAAKGDRHGIVNGLLAKYDFTNGGEGVDVTVVPDLSGNGRNLTHVGAATSRIKYTYAAANTANLRRVM